MKFRSFVYLIVLCGSIQCALAAPKVVVSVAPVHSLVQGVLQGVGKAELLFKSSQSPHGASLSPSLVRAVVGAELLVWVGAELEAALGRVVEGIDSLEQITLLKQESMLLLPGREGGIFASSDHDPQENTHKHLVDPHIWLSPQNAAAIVHDVTNWLMKNDPDNQDQYKNNSVRVLENIGLVHSKGKQQLDRAGVGKFIVFHDAFQYFEKDFGVQPLATITAQPESSIGARRITEIRHFILENEVRCIFIEPQFVLKTIDTIIQGSAVEVTTLDPLGFNMDPGPNLWFDLINRIVAQFSHCSTNQ